MPLGPSWTPLGRSEAVLENVTGRLRASAKRQEASASRLARPAGSKIGSVLLRGRAARKIVLAIYV